jgi:L-threonylcarbamoyladenylate synthase
MKLPVSTKILEPSEAGIEEAANLLRRGELVAFPTETVYGLGADAFNPEAVAKIFTVKGRPADNPLIVHIADIKHFFTIGKDISLVARKLAEAFWPGPLTLVVAHNGNIPSVVTAGLGTVAVRMPNHPVALQLINSLGRGIVAPSANLSGKPSPTNAQHVFDDFEGKIQIILDGGQTRIGVESTVVDVTIDPPIVLRLGGLSREVIERVAGAILTTSEQDLLRRSPGTRHRHYAPQANIILIPDGDAKQFLETLQYLLLGGKRVGCIVHSPVMALPHDKQMVKIHHLLVGEYAHQLFDLMRTFDREEVEVILVEEIPDVGIGEAVMDRVRRAAGKSEN